MYLKTKASNRRPVMIKQYKATSPWATCHLETLFWSLNSYLHCHQVHPSIWKSVAVLCLFTAPWYILHQRCLASQLCCPCLNSAWHWLGKVFDSSFVTWLSASIQADSHILSSRLECDSVRSCVSTEIIEVCLQCVSFKHKLNNIQKPHPSKVIWSLSMWPSV